MGMGGDMREEYLSRVLKCPRCGYDMLKWHDPAQHWCCENKNCPFYEDETEHNERVKRPPAEVKPEQHGHPEFHRILDEMRALHVKKAADYGLGADVLANCRGSIEFGIPAWIGVVMRMNDKMTRLKSFAQKGSLANESVEDSLLDIACYAIIALILYREATSGKG